jgi:hypothetical protein
LGCGQGGGEGSGGQPGGAVGGSLGEHGVQEVGRFFEFVFEKKYVGQVDVGHGDAAVVGDRVLDG